MRVLLCVDIEDKEGFQYKDHLLEALSINCKVVYGIEKFWTSNEDFDIVLIQWQEALNKWSLPTKDIVEKTISRLNHWSTKSKVILTRHNVSPHKLKNDLSDYFFEEVNRICHGIIHLGHYSHKDYLNRYSSFANLQKHCIIPHPQYEKIISSETKEEAREKLNIDTDSIVITAFGKIRSDIERELIYSSFKSLKVKNKVLIVPRWGLGTSKNRLCRYLRILQYFILRLNKRLKLGKSYVSNEDLVTYLQASDIIMIPRINILNSGNLFLGFSFGKVVIGPAVGNIKETLEKTNNPTFNPIKKQSVSVALLHGVELVYQNHGLVNKKYSNDHWNLKIIGSKYFEFFSDLHNEK